MSAVKVATSAVPADAVIAVVVAVVAVAAVAAVAAVDHWGDGSRPRGRARPVIGRTEGSGKCKACTPRLGVY